MIKIAVFGSGSGTNFEAIARSIRDEELNAEIVLVVSDQKNALIIPKAKKLGIETFTFNAKDYATKADYEKVIIAKMQSLGVEWVILAGFMRLVGNELLEAYPRHIVNIHPSLLPKYKGKDAIQRAYEKGETQVGVTIHYVDEGMDTGEIITQRSIDISHTQSLAEVEELVHVVEHCLYPLALQSLFNP